MVTEKNGGVDYRFRLLYALGMIFIVSGHCSGGGVSLFYDWFPPYAFHLGLFAFCSGYFYRDENGADLGAYALRKAKTLLLPMYLWNLFYALLLVVLRRFGFDIGLPPSFATLVTIPCMRARSLSSTWAPGSWSPCFCARSSRRPFGSSAPCPAPAGASLPPSSSVWPSARWA